MSDSKEINTKIKGDNNTVNTGPHIHKSNSEVKMPYKEHKRMIELERKDAVEEYKRNVELERKDAVEEYKKANTDSEKEEPLRKINEFDKRLSDLPQAFEEAQELIKNATNIIKTIFDRVGKEIGEDKLTEIRIAFENGDFSKADNLFAEIESDKKLNILELADIALIRGQIAEEQVRWQEAAKHYAYAVQLNPNFYNTMQAQTFALNIDDCDSALYFGKKTQKAAIDEYGKESTEYAASLNNLGGVYQGTGQYKEAELLHKKSLQLREKLLDENDSDIANSLNNISGLYQLMGKYQEAEPLLKRAIKILKETLGKEHPNTATSINNLGVCYQKHGDYKNAELSYDEALRIRRKKLGKNHPGIANSLNNLAGLYYAQGRNKEAEDICEQVVYILETTLGSEHPRTQFVKEDFAQAKKLFPSA